MISFYVMTLEGNRNITAMKKNTLLFLVWSLFLLQACSSSVSSPEDEIRQVIKSGVEAAESRSSDDLADLIHTDYIDQKAFNKTRMIKLVRLYFFKHKNIYLFTKISSIEFHAEDAALVTMHVAMAGSVISDASMLSSLRARIYKFELQLIKQDTWLLREAKWQPASMVDMQ